MKRTISNLTIKVIDDGERILEGIASTPRPDRVGDVVESDGVEYDLPIPLLLDHDHSKVVGEVEHIAVSRDGIRFRARIAKIAEPGAARDLVDTAWSYVRAGLRKAVSIGFRSLEHAVLPGGGLRFLSWEFLELSIVGIPAQPDAKITGFKGIVDDHHPRVVKVGCKPSAIKVVRVSKGKSLKIKRHRVIRLSADEMPSKAAPGPARVVKLTARDYGRANARVVRL